MSERSEGEAWVPMPAALLDLSDYVVLVTGGSGGIGAAVAHRFVAAGAGVVTGARRGSVHTPDAVVADLTTEHGVDRLVAEAVGRHGRLDVVVNAAGVQPVTELADLTAADFAAVLDADLTGAHLLTRAAAAVMSGGGSITHIASIEATQPARGHAHYGAAKAGLVAYTRAAAVEYGGRGVRVNTVSPGLVHRDGIEEQWPDGVRRWRSAAPLGRLGRPDDVAHACLFLASPLASWISGHDLVVDGGVSAAPTW